MIRGKFAAGRFSSSPAASRTRRQICPRIRVTSPASASDAALLDLVAAGTLAVEFALMSELAAVRRLVARYRDRPMSLADACLVRLAELFDDAEVITLDRDFSIYRKHGRQTVPLISPGAR
jgi:hypothetical protein